MCRWAVGIVCFLCCVYIYKSFELHLSIYTYLSFYLLSFFFYFIFFHHVLVCVCFSSVSVMRLATTTTRYRARNQKIRFFAVFFSLFFALKYELTSSPPARSRRSKTSRATWGNFENNDLKKHYNWYHYTVLSFVKCIYTTSVICLYCLEIIVVYVAWSKYSEVVRFVWQIKWKTNTCVDVQLNVS